MRDFGRLATLVFLLAAGGARAASQPTHDQDVPDSTDPQCWRAAFAPATFAGQEAYRPPLTIQAAKNGRDVRIDYEVSLADLSVGGRTVRNAPVAKLRLREGFAWIYYYRNGAARRCVVPASVLASQAFRAAWGYAPVRFRLKGRDRFGYDVTSALAYSGAAIAAVSKPPRAQFGGVDCRASNLHTHGLLVPPTKADPAAGVPKFGDYVLSVAAPAGSAPTDCAGEFVQDPPPPAVATTTHAHGALPQMRHAIGVPQTPAPTAGAQDWLRHAGATRSLHPMGLYFVHPHPHGYSAGQLTGATAGMLTIGDSSYLKLPPATSGFNFRHLLLKDMQVARAAPGGDLFDYVAKTEPALCGAALRPQDLPVNLGGCNLAQDRQWLFTVNGQRYPVITDTRRGELEVFRVVNASPTVSYALAVVEETSMMVGPNLARQPLQILSSDGAPAQIVGAADQKFPARILLMPGARVEFAINFQLPSRDFVLISEGVTTGGDTWQPVALAKIHLPPAPPHAAPTPNAAMRSGAPSAAAPASAAPDGDALSRVTVRGADLKAPAPAAPATQRMMRSAPTWPGCVDLTDRTRERVIHFVKNPTFSPGDPAPLPWSTIQNDMFGVITAIRPAGDVNPWNAQFFLHKQGEAAHLLTPVQPTAPQTLADYVGAFQSSVNDLRPAFGAREDMGTICAVLQKNEDVAETWVIENWTNELHNFHLHQTKFSILQNEAPAYRNLPCGLAAATDCTPSDQLLATFYQDTAGTAHDTIPVPRGVGEGCLGVIGAAGCNPGRVSVQIRFGRPELVAPTDHGDFVYHCHILEHEDRGMMGLVRVIDPTRFKGAPASHKHVMR